MSIEQPRITIVTPSFNSAAYIRNAIESVLSQDYPNLEYMVIDGGSTDGTVEIIEEYSKQLSYWVSEKDEGQSDAIIKGFSRATGELLHWLDSDNVLLPNALKLVGERYVSAGKPDIISGNIFHIDGQGKVIRCKRGSKPPTLLSRFGVVNLPVTFWKRDLYEAVGGLDRSLHHAMDQDLLFRFVRRGARFSHINRYIFAFRFHEQTKGAKAGTAATLVPLYKRLPLLLIGRTYGHPEGKDVLTRNFPHSSYAHAIARLLYKLWRSINGNYVREWMDSRKVRGMAWQSGFRLLEK